MPAQTQNNKTTSIPGQSMHQFYMNNWDDFLTLQIADIVVFQIV